MPANSTAADRASITPTRTSSYSQHIAAIAIATVAAAHATACIATAARPTVRVLGQLVPQQFAQPPMGTEVFCSILEWHRAVLRMPRMLGPPTAGTAVAPRPSADAASNAARPTHAAELAVRRLLLAASQ